MSAAHNMDDRVLAALAFAVPERWYVNPELATRAYLRRVEGHLVYLCVHPAFEADADDVWQVEFFAAAWVPCEDLSKAYALGPCPSTCPCCFQPAIERVVGRVIAKHERALYEKRRRAALLRQKGQGKTRSRT